jgi:hypothetical protein
LLSSSISLSDLLDFCSGKTDPPNGSNKFRPYIAAYHQIWITVVYSSRISRSWTSSPFSYARFASVIRRWRMARSVSSWLRSGWSHLATARYKSLRVRERSTGAGRLTIESTIRRDYRVARPATPVAVSKTFPTAVIDLKRPICCTEPKCKSSPIFTVVEPGLAQPGRNRDRSIRWRDHKKQERRPFRRAAAQVFSSAVPVTGFEAFTVIPLRSSGYGTH